MSLCSDGPDTSGINSSAVTSAETSRRALDWFTQEYERTAPDRKRAADEAIAISQSQRGLMDTQAGLAKDYADYNRTTFRPLEQRMVADAQAYDTPERRNQAATEAVADVEMAAGRQRQARMANLQSYGVAPDAMKTATMDASDGINVARLSAGAAGGARKQVEATGWARMADAANLGRNLPSAQATAVQTASQAGAGALGANSAALGATMSGTPLMQAGFGASMQGNQIAGNLYGKAADIQSRDDGGLGALMGGAGGIMQGLGAMGYSSKKLKTKKRELNEEEALEAVNDPDAPVEAWEYEPGMASMSESATPGTHVGQYAEDVNRTQGEEAAPGGQMVNFARMAQNNGKAIQALTKEVEALEARLEELAA